MKPGVLSAEEWEMMKKHPEIGYRIAQSSNRTASIAEAVLTHHDRWDGTGYPLGLKGNEIPLISRIFAIMDAYDIMTRDTVYRKAISHAEALNELRRCAGIQFDPELVEKFIGMASCSVKI
jgi:HD-GYP domain-containing protein (c-di-GMP phosphodiesterase class II)